MKKIIVFMILMFIPFNVKAISVTLEKCVDGDTAWFNYNGEKIKARFLAIDTPESTNQIEEYGKEASNYTCNELTNAKKIELEYDNNSDKKDKYGRDLVWIFVDGDLLQEKIIRNGFGEVAYLYGDYKYTSILKESEIKAKKDKINMWSEEEDSYNFIIIIPFIILLIFYVLKKYRK